MQDNGKSLEASFVEAIEARADADKAFAADLRTLATSRPSYRALGWIVGFNVNIEYEDAIAPYALVASSLCWQKPVRNGKLGLGAALRLLASRDGTGADLDNERDPYLERVMSCTSVTEICNVVEGIIRQLQSRQICLDFARLLNELRWFGNEDSARKTKRRWVRDFYSPARKEQETGPATEEL